MQSTDLFHTTCTSPSLNYSQNHQKMQHQVFSFNCRFGGKKSVLLLNKCIMHCAFCSIPLHCAALFKWFWFSATEYSDRMNERKMCQSLASSNSFQTHKRFEWYIKKPKTMKRIFLQEISPKLIHSKNGWFTTKLHRNDLLRKERICRWVCLKNPNNVASNTEKWFFFFYHLRHLKIITLIEFELMCSVDSVAASCRCSLTKFDCGFIFDFSKLISNQKSYFFSCHLLYRSKFIC